MADSGDNYCFACGKENPIGLHLEFELTDDILTAKKILAREYQGYENVAHGGIVTTLLDEAMCCYIKEKFDERAMTGRLNIRYHLPTPVGQELTITAGTESQRLNILTMNSKITLPDGTVTAEASAKFALVSLK